MIVKNEEMHIARCLDSVRELADEIIVVEYRLGGPDGRNSVQLHIKGIFI